MATLRMNKKGQVAATARSTARAAQREYVLRGVAYEYVSTICENSGEANVVRVQRGGQDYALKIYFPDIDINRETLRIVANIDCEFIIRIYDFGYIYIEGKKRAYELMEYLQGGTLSTPPAEDNCQLSTLRSARRDACQSKNSQLFRRIALQAAAAIACCHNYNIIHKDVKPSNIFFRDEERTQVVLGDFGIASVIADDGALHRTTQARTPLYAAPEMYSDVIDGEVEISPAADYYSLGITLLTIANSQFSALNSQLNEREFLKRKAEGRLPGMEKLSDRERLIIQGLTAVRPENRWTYREVEEWFTGGTPTVDTASPHLRYGAFVFDPERNMVAESIQELVPMMAANSTAAAAFLYAGKVSEWLERCGNTKMAVAIDDITKNRYPADKALGTTTAIYTLDETFPYTDIRGDECNTIHDAAMSMMAYADEYAAVLKNSHDNLWAFLRVRCAAEGIRSERLEHPAIKSATDVKATALAIDRDMPFLPNHRTQTVKEITHAFGYEAVTQDDWAAITDGRLEAWLELHEGAMAAETARLMSGAEPIEVLYNIDRTAAYDLREATTPETIGEALSTRLTTMQRATEGEVEALMREYSDRDGRFARYATLHGWYDVAEAVAQTLDMRAPENRERLGAYDNHTAAYRAVRVMGVAPKYKLPSGDVLTDGLHIDNHHRSDIRTEMGEGTFRQWLAAFYHEDPTADMREEYAYERALERWIEALGYYNAQDRFFTRFHHAKKEAAERTAKLRVDHRRTHRRIAVAKATFYTLMAVVVALLCIIGIKDRAYTFEHYVATIVLPVGGVTAIVIATRAFLRGYGFMLCCLYGALGFATALAPAHLLRYIDANAPSLTILASVLIVAIYTTLCHLTGRALEAKEDDKLIETLTSNKSEEDLQAVLIDPLYYTFRVKNDRFTGSNYSALDSAEDRLRDIGGEITIHYAAATLLPIAIIAELLLS